MAKIKLTPTPELESRGIVAEQKSLDSRGIVAEPKVAKYTTEELLRLLDAAPHTETKVEKPEQNAEKPKGKTNPKQLEAAKRWNEKQAQIAIRIPHKVKQQITEHAANRNEKLVQFLIRAALEQIGRDNAE